MPLTRQPFRDGEGACHLTPLTGCPYHGAGLLGCRGDGRGPLPSTTNPLGSRRPPPQAGSIPVLWPFGCKAPLEEMGVPPTEQTKGTIKGSAQLRTPRRPAAQLLGTKDR